jgi:hypothetical protein
MVTITVIIFFWLAIKCKHTQSRALLFELNVNNNDNYIS